MVDVDVGHTPSQVGTHRQVLAVWAEHAAEEPVLAVLTHEDLAVTGLIKDPNSVVVACEGVDGGIGGIAGRLDSVDRCVLEGRDG